MGRLALHWQILIALGAGLVLGVLLDLLAKQGVLSADVVERAAAVGRGAGKLFLALLSMLVVPLIFSSLVTGVTKVPDMKGLRRMSFWVFGYYITTSLLAITVGLILVNLIGPGRGLDYADLAAAAAAGGAKAPQVAPTVGSGLSALWDVLFRMVPENVLAAASNNRLILSVIFFALLFGVFIKRLGGEHATLLSRFFEAFFEVMMRMTSWVISLAPYGIFGFVLALGASGGLGIAGDLGLYMLTVAAALAVHACVTLPLILWIFGRRSPIEYLQAMSPALVTAFSTASSNATLPLTMKCVEERAGVSNRVGSFTLPLGATINMDGTALYEAIAVLFISQTLTELTPVQQVVVALTALLASIGAAGIPHAGTVMMVIVLNAVGLPSDAVIVILAVDRILDMMRTTVNVWSDCCGAAVVDRHTRQTDGASEAETASGASA